MNSPSRFSLTFVVVCALLVAACSTPTPAEKVAASRAEYKATLNSFFVKETPLEMAEPVMDGDEGAEAEAGDEASGDEAEGDGEEAMDVPVRLDAVLDVIVQHDSSAPLDGITLDVSMVDGQQNEVDSWRYWVDTKGMPKANQRPYSLVFEGVDYQEGYGFFVEVRTPIAESERGEYREFEGL